MKLFLTISIFLIGFFSYSQSNSCNNNAGAELTVGSSCTNTTMNSTNNSDYWNSASGCNATDQDDVWAWFTATSTSTTITYTPTNRDPILTLLTGACSPTMGSLACADNGGNGTAETIVYATTIGTVYRIRVQRFSSNNNMNGSICVYDTPPPPSPPTNDDPCNATPISVGAAGLCSLTTGDNTNATSSAGVPAPGCAAYSGQDVWFSITVPASGNVTISTAELTGFTDGGLATYSGTCGALSLLSCNDDSGPGLFGEIIHTGLTPGATIWIRVWEYGGGSTGDFSICAYEPDPCGNTGTTVGTNDYCATPATLTKQTGSFSANTAATFSQDLPGNVNSVFCGSIENNSWYQFTAGSTTESFPITSISGCTGGIQAEIYSISYTGAGCCNSFTSVSNCYSPGNTTLGTVTATPLIVGNDYMLMIDGFGGANCDFTISGWTGINILPVELTQFLGYANENENLLKWTTASESNNEYFYIEKSTDGINYKKIGEVQGSGNSSVRIDYEFSDAEINNSIVYYRLTQVDFDGTNEQVGTLVMTRELKAVTVFPNPANAELNLAFNTGKSGIYTVDFIDVNGKIVSETIQISNNNTVQSLIFNQLDSGIYFVKISDKNSNVIEMIKVVKE